MQQFLSSDVKCISLFWSCLCVLYKNVDYFILIGFFYITGFCIFQEAEESYCTLNYLLFLYSLLKKIILFFRLISGADDAAGFAPSFVEKPRIIPNDTGTLITMRCKCKAKPIPAVTWYRGTTIVKESSKIKMRIVDKEEDTYELILEIKVRFRLAVDSSL